MNNEDNRNRDSSQDSRLYEWNKKIIGMKKNGGDLKFQKKRKQIQSLIC